MSACRISNVHLRTQSFANEPQKPDYASVANDPVINEAIAQKNLSRNNRRARRSLDYGTAAAPVFPTVLSDYPRRL